VSGICLLQAPLFSAQKSKKKSKVMPDRESYLLGKYRCSRHPGYKRISKEFSDATPHYLLKEVAESFELMAKKAEKDDIKLIIVSGFRSFYRQKQIFEAKFQGERLVDNINLLQKYPLNPEKRVLKILKYSSAPGTSRHHWGTDLDINSVSPAYFKTKAGKKTYEWLEKNAPQFGFHQPYTKGRKTGYMEEKWHWSYTPVSKKLLKEFLNHFTFKDLKGFKGCKNLPSSIIQDYVLGINDECI